MKIFFSLFTKLLFLLILTTHPCLAQGNDDPLAMELQEEGRKRREAKVSAGGFINFYHFETSVRRAQAPNDPVHLLKLRRFEDGDQITIGLGDSNRDRDWEIHACFGNEKGRVQSKAVDSGSLRQHDRGKKVFLPKVPGGFQFPLLYILGKKRNENTDGGKLAISDDLATDRAAIGIPATVERSTELIAGLNSFTAEYQKDRPGSRSTRTIALLETLGVKTNLDYSNATNSEIANAFVEEFVNGNFQEVKLTPQITGTLVAGVAKEVLPKISKLSEKDVVEGLGYLTAALKLYNYFSQDEKSYHVVPAHLTICSEPTHGAFCSVLMTGSVYFGKNPLIQRSVFSVVPLTGNYATPQVAIHTDQYTSQSLPVFTLDPLHGDRARLPVCFGLKSPHSGDHRCSPDRSDNPADDENDLSNALMMLSDRFIPGEWSYQAKGAVTGKLVKGNAIYLPGRGELVFDKSKILATMEGEPSDITFLSTPTAHGETLSTPTIRLYKNDNDSWNSYIEPGNSSRNSSDSLFLRTGSTPTRKIRLSRSPAFFATDAHMTDGGGRPVFLKVHRKNGLLDWGSDVQKVPPVIIDLEPDLSSAMPGDGILKLSYDGHVSKEFQVKLSPSETPLVEYVPGSQYCWIEAEEWSPLISKIEVNEIEGKPITQRGSQSEGRVTVFQMEKQLPALEIVDKIELSLPGEKRMALPVAHNFGEVSARFDADGIFPIQDSEYQINMPASSTLAIGAERSLLVYGSEELMKQIRKKDKSLTIYSEIAGQERKSIWSSEDKDYTLNAEPIRIEMADLMKHPGKLYYQVSEVVSFSKTPIRGVIEELGITCTGIVKEIEIKQDKNNEDRFYILARRRTVLEALKSVSSTKEGKPVSFSGVRGPNGGYYYLSIPETPQRSFWLDTDDGKMLFEYRETETPWGDPVESTPWED